MDTLKNMFSNECVKEEESRSFIFHRSLWGRVIVEATNEGYQCKGEYVGHVTLFFMSILIFVSSGNYATYLSYLSIFGLIFSLVGSIILEIRTCYVKLILRKGCNVCN